MTPDVGYACKEFCVLLMVLLTGFLSPEGCRLSADWLGHVNSANCALLLQCSAGCKARAEEGLFEKGSQGGFNGKASLGEERQLLQFLKGRLMLCHMLPRCRLRWASSPRNCTLSLLMRPRSSFAGAAALCEL